MIWQHNQTHLMNHLHPRAKAKALGCFIFSNRDWIFTNFSRRVLFAADSQQHFFCVISLNLYCVSLLCTHLNVLNFSHVIV